MKLYFMKYLMKCLSLGRLERRRQERRQTSRPHGLLLSLVCFADGLTVYKEGLEHMVYVLICMCVSLMIAL